MPSIGLIIVGFYWLIDEWKRYPWLLVFQIGDMILNVAHIRVFVQFTKTANRYTLHDLYVKDA